MKLDFATSHKSGHSVGHRTATKQSFFARKAPATAPMQGAIRINSSPDKARKKSFPLQRTAMVAAFFVFSALIATVSNGNVDGPSSLNPITLIQNNTEKNRSETDPDFYFIESNQFVPGSTKIQVAAYNKNPESRDNIHAKSTADAREKKQAFDQHELNIESEPPEPLQSQFVKNTVVVKSGDTLSELLLDNGVDASELHGLLTNKYIKKHLTTLRINQELNFQHNQEGQFLSLSLRLGQERKLVISRGESSFAGAIIEMPLKRQIHTTSAAIESSLFLAGQGAGLSQKTIMNLVDIFQWDIDFGLDIRKGNKFKVIYEKLYRDGEYLGEGDILAAEFQSSGRTIKAIRYTDFTGRTSYYTPEGRSMRKAFLRNPVDVVRITSHFNPKRKHPVLHTIRAHKGTDYGAPIGTPIRSTGDGKIIFAGVKGGYGNTVVVRHGDKYTTLYAHMSRFAKAIKNGKRIQQGQIIGYVGKTGRVTGAHLHYEFRINGVHKNPLKVKLPGARPIPGKYKADFLSKSRDLLAALESLDTTTLAMSKQ